jgi:hypothetical protein
LETQRLLIAKAILSKKTMLKVSQYLTSNSTTEPYQLKQHGNGTKTDMKMSGTE